MARCRFEINRYVLKPTFLLIQVLSILFLIFWYRSAMAEPTIIFNKISEVSRPAKILLKDIASLKGFNKKKREMIENIEFGKTPKAGDSLFLTSYEISKTIRAKLSLIEGQLGQKIKLEVPSRIQIRRGYFRIGKADLVETLSEQFTQICEDCEFVLSDLNLPLLSGFSLAAKWDIKYTSERLPRGHVSLPIKVTEKDKSKTYWMSASVAVFKKVPVATRSLSIGDRLTIADYALKNRNITYAMDGMPSIESIKGRKISRTIHAGDIIWRNSLAREYAVQRGQTVQAISDDQFVEVSMRAISQDKGEIGDTIRVMNSTTKKVFSGIVKEPGVVTIR